jgi:hypothetical protein
VIRGFATVGVIFLCSASLSATELVSESEIVGTWKFDASTLSVRELMIPNSYPRPQLPTNYISFEMVFRKDGSFTIKNLPANFFCDDWPASKECNGKWKLTTEFPLLGPKIPQNAYSELDLQLSGPFSCIRGEPLVRSSSGKLGIIFGPYREKNNAYEWDVLIAKKD